MAVYTTIDNPAEYFETVLYTGNGASTPGGSGSVQTVSSLDFAPNLVWIKDRTQAGHNHNLMDTVRAAPNILMSDSSAAEITDSSDALTSFTSNGFVIGDNGEGTQSLELNKSSNTYVAWCWKAGTTSGLSGGDTTPSGYSINTTSKFGIYAYTGSGSAATITHGLGVVPKVIIFKKRTDESLTGDWAVHHGSLASNASMYLNSTNGQDTSDLLGTDPTSSVFTVDSDYANKSSKTYVAYLFGEVQGFSKFGSYTGNGNADGAFINTGFKPAFVITKRYDAHGENWYMFDNKRGGSNPGNHYLYPNITNAEVQTEQIDILSNGFKCRTTNAAVNLDGGTLVYMAFAEAPFVNSNGVPCNAR